MAVTGELYDAIIRIVDQRVGEIKVTREDFDELAKNISELSENVRALSVEMRQLAEAQRHTDERLNGLAEAQMRTEVRLNELAEAQKRTEERLNELAEAQKRTDETVKELAEAQKRTEEELAELGRSVKELAKAVGRLSDTVGYGLEDVAKVMLPPWLEKHERVRVDELDRHFLNVDGETIEINLHAVGVKGRRAITVVGEAKSRIHAADVRAFAETLSKIRKALRETRVLPLMFGYWVHPAATQVGKSLGIRLVASYQR